MQCVICNDNKSDKCSACQAPSENNLVMAVTAAFSKINNLKSKVSNLERILSMHNEKYLDLEVNSDSERGGGHGRGCSSHQGEPKRVLSKENTKKDRRKENPRKSKALQDKNVKRRQVMAKQKMLK